MGSLISQAKCMGEYGSIWLHVGFLIYFKLITVTYDSIRVHIAAYDYIWAC